MDVSKHTHTHTLPGQARHPKRIVPDKAAVGEGQHAQETKERMTMVHVYIYVIQESPPLNPWYCKSYILYVYRIYALSC